MKKFNTLAWVHNSLLRQTIAQLRVKYPGARIIYADYYSAAIQFILHPEKFGQLIFLFYFQFIALSHDLHVEAI